MVCACAIQANVYIVTSTKAEVMWSGMSFCLCVALGKKLCMILHGRSAQSQGDYILKVTGLTCAVI